MKLINAIILCVAALAVPALAQEKPADANMQILLDKVKADKKLVVAANMDLNEAEGKVFWPLYEAYQKDIQAVNDASGQNDPRLCRRIQSERTNRRLGQAADQ